MTKEAPGWLPADMSLHAQWAALAGPDDPGLHELWELLIEVYSAYWAGWPTPLSDQVATLLDEVQAPTSAAEWDAFGALLAQMDAVIEWDGDA